MVRADYFNIICVLQPKVRSNLNRKALKKTRIDVRNKAKIHYYLIV